MGAVGAERPPGALVQAGRQVFPEPPGGPTSPTCWYLGRTCWWRPSPLLPRHGALFPREAQGGHGCRVSVFMKANAGPGARGTDPWLGAHGDDVAILTRLGSGLLFSRL